MFCVSLAAKRSLQAYFRLKCLLVFEHSQQAGKPGVCLYEESVRMYCYPVSHSPEPFWRNVFKSTRFKNDNHDDDDDEDDGDNHDHDGSNDSNDNNNGNNNNDNDTTTTTTTTSTTALQAVQGLLRHMFCVSLAAKRSLQAYFRLKCLLVFEHSQQAGKPGVCLYEESVRMYCYPVSHSPEPFWRNLFKSTRFKNDNHDDDDDEDDGDNHDHDGSNDSNDNNNSNNNNDNDTTTTTTTTSTTDLQAVQGLLRHMFCVSSAAKRSLQAYFRLKCLLCF
ncbi:unnamed protein product [Polarella glacialis]|uniref:Uncharacterized protein n=1 Tax=Polarella glacialis TaxID=89957 RepID=A0A813G485_POLGL|nr:unnamed protein product [Polarella glacialis]